MRTTKVKATKEVQAQVVKDEKTFLEKQLAEKISAIDTKAKDEIEKLKKKYAEIFKELPAKHEYMEVNLPDYDEPKKGKKGKKGTRKSYSDEEEAKIMKMKAEGKTDKEIGEAVGRTQGAISTHLQEKKKK